MFALKFLKSHVDYGGCTLWYISLRTVEPLTLGTESIAVRVLEKTEMKMKQEKSHAAVITRLLSLFGSQDLPVGVTFKGYL